MQVLTQMMQPAARHGLVYVSPTLQEKTAHDIGELQSSMDFQPSRRRSKREVCLRLLCIVVCILTIYMNWFREWVWPNAKRNAASAVAQDSRLEELRAEFNYPGLAVACSQNGSFSSRVAGLRRLDATPMIEDTDQFHLASNTKAMTATLIALLVKDGHIQWNTTLREAIPALADSMADENKNTTVEMLTAHRSGMDVNWHDEPAFYESLYHKDLTPTQGRWLLTSKALSKAPAGTTGKFNYDNTNYLIAGTIIDLVTGSSWEDFIQSRLFKPLGMQNCGFGPNKESSLTSVDSPWPHEWVSKPYGPAAPLRGVDFDHRDKPASFNPAARVHAPMEQYNKFLQAHVKGAKGMDTPLGLSQETFRFLHKPYADDDTYTPGGWHCDRRSPKGDCYRISHVGSNRYNYVVAWALVGGENEGTYMGMTNIGGVGVGDGLRKVVDMLMAGEPALCPRR